MGAIDLAKHSKLLRQSKSRKSKNKRKMMTKPTKPNLTKLKPVKTQLKTAVRVKLKAKSKMTNYDVAEYLQTPADMAAYLDAWLEEAPEDATGIARALGDIARAKGMTQVAKDAGLSRESLYRALSADGNPSLATILKVSRALGVKFNASVIG
jgi:probable addiction module antidote protein